MILNRGEADGQRRSCNRRRSISMARNQMGECRVRRSRPRCRPVADAEFFPGMPKTWGLSFMINTEQAPTGRTAGSQVGGARQLLLLDRSQEGSIGGVYLTQILPFADKKSLPLFFEFEKAVYRQPS